MGRGDRFQQGRWDGDVQREDGRQMRDEGCVQQPLRHVANKAMECPYLALVAQRVLAIPTAQVQSERMFSTAGLTVNKRRGSLDPENVELLIFLWCNWTAVDALGRTARLLMVGGSCCCALAFRLMFY